MIDLIAFDADDTLWQNETLYLAAQSQFKQLLARYHDPEWIAQRLDQTEARNLEHFGYGIKSFILSMIETAVELTEGRIQGEEVQQIVNFGKDMLHTPIQPLDHVEETVARLAESHDLMIITKGDLLDQETKVARSGLARYFKYVEITSGKSRDTYRAILTRHQVEPSRFMMVGNSLKSDILPVVELGGIAVYIPHPLTWAHENQLDRQIESDRYFELEHIGLLPALVERLSHQGENRADRDS
jgi:putative hydrolase of the HAD superfamily